MSVTLPWTSSPIETRSPIRIGCVIASSTPETRLAITWRPAKPMMIPRTAVEARTPVAKRLIEVNWLSASATPIRMITRKRSLRISRRRVRAPRESSPVSSRTVASTARPIRTRSTMTAIRIATASVIAAEISSPCCCQKLWVAARTIASGSISIMVHAVFLDALGTLVELEPPWVSLRERVPSDVSDQRLEDALRAEMAYYRDHAHEGRDEASLADLRERCAAIVSEKLGIEIGVDELVDAIRFDAYPDAIPALRELREEGRRLVAVSNWDCSLPTVLERCGLGELLDGAVSSAVAGARKPDRAIFEPALELAGCGPDEALHVGDTPEEDIEGARAAGIRSLLIARDGIGGDISSLREIREHL